MTEPRLLLFDCDGTLADSFAAIGTAMAGAFTAAGHPAPPLPALRSLIGLSLPKVVEALAPTLSPEDRSGVVAHYRRAYVSTVTASPEPLFDGIRETLDALNDPRTVLGIVTGKSRQGLDRILDVHGLADRFVTTVTADDAASKPAPEMVLQALAATGFDAPAAVVIGDSTLDMAMAANAGVAAIGVAWGAESAETLLTAGAARVAETPATLPLHVKALLP